jgi:hypothetical protein
MTKLHQDMGRCNPEDYNLPSHYREKFETTLNIIRFSPLNFEIKFVIFKEGTSCFSQMK